MQYGIPEGSSPIDLPETKIDETAFQLEEQMAAFVQRPEWEKLKEHLENRIKTYQNLLPGGMQPSGDFTELGQNWLVADRVIGELRAIIATYEGIAENVTKTK